MRRLNKWALLVLLTAPILAQSVNFNAPRTFGFHNGPAYNMATADFNGDGKPDIVASVGGDYEILLGNGDGTFNILPPGSGPDGLVFYVAVADFNGDGIPDLALATSYGLAIALGNGDGTFQTAKNFLAGSYLTFVATGDFNGDGKTDVIATFYGMIRRSAARAKRGPGGPGRQWRASSWPASGRAAPSGRPGSGTCGSFGLDPHPRRALSRAPFLELGLHPLPVR